MSKELREQFEKETKKSIWNKVGYSYAYGEWLEYKLQESDQQNKELTEDKYRLLNQKSEIIAKYMTLESKLKESEQQNKEFKEILSELKKHYFIEVDSERQPKADIGLLLSLWDWVDESLNK